MITMLKSKLQQVVVTQSSESYKGSITIDLDLMDAAGFFPYERVEVNNFNGNRDATYILPGERGSGVIGINGALSPRHKIGDKIHVLAYQTVSKPKRVRIVVTDENNKIKEVIFV